MLMDTGVVMRLTPAECNPIVGNRDTAGALGITYDSTSESLVCADCRCHALPCRTTGPTPADALWLQQLSGTIRQPLA